ncbi:MAG: citrate lyase acyl carrier protein [bacterium]
MPRQTRNVGRRWLHDRQKRNEQGHRHRKRPKSRKTGKLMRIGTAGTLESNDAVLTVRDGVGIKIEIESIVDAFFHDQIEMAIRAELAVLGCRDVFVKCEDKGALDCTIRARLRAAVRRMEEDHA